MLLDKEVRNRIMKIFKRQDRFENYTSTDILMNIEVNDLIQCCDNKNLKYNYHAYILDKWGSYDNTLKSWRKNIQFDKLTHLPKITIPKIHEKAIILKDYTPPQCLDQFYKKLRYNPFT